MIIYLAGTGFTIDREELLIRKKANRLYSYVWHGDNGVCKAEWELRFSKEPKLKQKTGSIKKGGLL
jgi:hypothetical protein